MLQCFRSEIINAACRANLSCIEELCYIDNKHKIQTSWYFHDDLIKLYSYNKLSVAIQDKIITDLEIMSISLPDYTSLPLYLTDDVKKITISFRPRYDSLPLPSYKTTFSLPWIQSRVWGISAGLYSATLFDEIYNTRTQDSVNYTISKEKNSSKSEFGISALAYTGWNVSKNSDYLGGVWAQVCQLLQLQNHAFC